MDKLDVKVWSRLWGQHVRESWLVSWSYIGRAMLNFSGNLQNCAQRRPLCQSKMPRWLPSHSIAYLKCHIKILIVVHIIKILIVEFCTIIEKRDFTTELFCESQKRLLKQMACSSSRNHQHFDTLTIEKSESLFKGEASFLFADVTEGIKSWE